MDNTDLKILEILQNNCRVSMKELGKTVGLTSPAVSERVKRMEESGVITGYRAIVNPEKLDRKIKAFIDISIKARNYTKFLEYVPNSDKIIECHHVTGGDCMTLKILVKDMMELEELIDEMKKYGDTKTSIILSSPVEYRTIL